MKTIEQVRTEARDYRCPASCLRLSFLLFTLACWTLIPPMGMIGLAASCHLYPLSAMMAFEAVRASTPE